MKKYVSRMSKIFSLFIVSLISVLFLADNTNALGNCPGNQVEWFYDSDHDLYGDPNNSYCAVNSPKPEVDWVLDNTDCDDNDAAINPGAEDICDDSIDQDCSGSDYLCTKFRRSIHTDYSVKGFSVQEVIPGGQGQGGYILLGPSTYGGDQPNASLFKVDTFGLLLPESPPLRFLKHYGTPLNYEDRGFSVVVDSNNGYVFCGNTTNDLDPYTVSSLWVVKTDINGNQLPIANEFPGVGIESGGESIQETSDGGFIIAGFAKIEGSGLKVYLLKTDSNLAPEADWGNTALGYSLFDNGGADFNWGYSVQQTADGGYIVLGQTGNNMLLIKTDGNGNELWSKNFGGSNDDIGFSVKQTTDGGYILLGSTSSYGASLKNMYLIKTDGSGNVNGWNDYGSSGKVYDTGVITENGHSVLEVSDGFILVGDAYIDPIVGTEITMLKVDKVSGALMNGWGSSGSGYSTFDSEVGGTHEYGLEAQKTADGGFVIVGRTTNSPVGAFDIFIVKTNPNGIAY